MNRNDLFSINYQHYKNSFSVDIDNRTYDLTKCQGFLQQNFKNFKLKLLLIYIFNAWKAIAPVQIHLIQPRICRQINKVYRICLQVLKVIYPIGNILEHIIACRVVGRLQSVRQTLPRVLHKPMKSVPKYMSSSKICPLKNRYTVSLYNTELLVTVAVIGMIPFLIAIIFMYFVVFIVIACKERIWSPRNHVHKPFWYRWIKNSKKEIDGEVW